MASNRKRSLRNEDEAILSLSLCLHRNRRYGIIVSSCEDCTVCVRTVFVLRMKGRGEKVKYSYTPLRDCDALPLQLYEFLLLADTVDVTGIFCYFTYNISKFCQFAN